MEMKRKPKIAAVVAAVVGILMASVGVMALQAGPEIYTISNLNVDETYFLLGNDENLDDNIVPVLTTLYLTNFQKKSSEEIKLIAYVVHPDTRVAENKNTTILGKIEGYKTGEIEVEVLIPNLDVEYNVDFLIFEDDLLVIKGSCEIGVHRSPSTMPGRNWDYTVDAGSLEFTNVRENTPL